MNLLYAVGGICLFILGALLTIIQIKIFKAGIADNQGFDVKLLGGGICLIMIGIAIIFKYL